MTKPRPSESVKPEFVKWPLKLKSPRETNQMMRLFKDKNDEISELRRKLAELETHAEAMATMLEETGRDLGMKFQLVANYRAWKESAK